ncbi:MAG: sorbitol dehydrogenase, partial [Planctomycetota bacterium]|nr:sorbitol dehydrogenase [Planctomycetota bacterium]
DAIIDAVGHPKIVNSALPLVKMAGAICVYGVIADSSITLEKHLGPLNFNLLLHQWPTRTYEAGAHEPICQLIQAGKLAAKDFITGSFPLDDFEKAFAATRQPGAVKTMLIF